ncbi:MAG: glycosyltransferase [Aestuariivirga sp.]|nr:glycosyltransferase [Aestuariivirga sp.]
MRAVFLTPVLPSRSGMGLAMRAGSQLKGLMRAFSVTTCVIPVIETGENPGCFASGFPASKLEMLDCTGQQDHYFRLISALSDPEERLVHFERYGKPSLSAAMSDAIARRVADLAARDGASHVHAFRSYLLPALDLLAEGVTRSIDLDEDDVSSCLSTARVMDLAGRNMAARWNRLEARAFDRLMAQKLTAFRAVTLANAEDLPGMLARYPGLPLRALPNGVPVPPLAATAGAGARRDLLFVGSLRYEPNVEGLLWFMTAVLPRLPGVRLLVAGRSPPPLLRAHARPGRVEFLGYVQNLAGAYRRAALAIAPMRSGGGTRLKILEAGAHAVPVVATPQSVAGLLQPGRFWGITASGPRHFAAACRHLLDHPREARRLGRLGRHVVASHFCSQSVEDAWAELFRAWQRGDEA